MGSSRDRLVEILQLAYSGELAAAHAYRGHARSVSDPAERDRIREIEEEEWHHRRQVGEMLSSLGTGPLRRREIRAAILGRVLSLLCRISGWLLPMYAAGKLESRNIREYEDAARFAHGCGRGEFVDCLLAMAEVEWEHEAYFRERVLRSERGRRLRIWSQPPPKSRIRESYAEETGGTISRATSQSRAS
jgi:rubrerythrin